MNEQKQSEIAFSSPVTRDGKAHAAKHFTH